MRKEKQIYYNEKFAHFYIEKNKTFILPNLQSILNKLTEWYPQLSFSEKDIDNFVIDLRKVNVTAI